MIDIEHEFSRAIRFAKASRIDFPLSKRVPWGCARVSFYGRERRCYEPQPDGDVMAFIAPVVEAGELVDLAAIDQRTNHVAFRLDVGCGLGFDAVAKARFGEQLIVLESAMDWLSDPIDTVWLRDLSTIERALEGVKVIACASIPLAERVMAFLPPSQRSRVQAPL